MVGNTAEAVHVQSICLALKKLGHQIFIVSGELETTGDSQGTLCPFPLSVIPSPNPLPVTSWLYQWANKHKRHSTSRSAQGPGSEAPRPAVGYVPTWQLHPLWSDLEQRISALRYQQHFYHQAHPLLEQERPDALYQRYTRYGLSGIRLARDLRIPLIVEMNASFTEPREWFRQPSPLYPWMIEQSERYLCLNATAVVIVSAAQTPYLQRLGVSEDRTLVLPNAVNLELFKPNKEAALAIRQRYGLLGKFVVGFISSMRPWHDVETLLEAIKLVKQSPLDICALIVGDGPARPALESRVKEMGLEGMVIFVGHVPHPEVSSFIESMDTTAVLCSDSLGSPMKLFEYLAMCKPVIASRSGQLTEIIQHRQNGMLVDPQNSLHVAEALLELGNNPHLRERLGKAARLTVESKHTWEHNAQAVVDLLERFGAK